MFGLSSRHVLYKDQRHSGEIKHEEILSMDSSFGTISLIVFHHIHTLTIASKTRNLFPPPRPLAMTLNVKQVEILFLKYVFQTVQDRSRGGLPRTLSRPDIQTSKKSMEEKESKKERNQSVLYILDMLIAAEVCKTNPLVPEKETVLIGMMCRRCWMFDVFLHSREGYTFFNSSTGIPHLSGCL